MLAAFGILRGLKEPLCAKPRPFPATTWASHPGLQEATFPQSPVYPLCPVLGVGVGGGVGGALGDDKAAVADPALCPSTSTLPPPSVRNSDFMEQRHFPASPRCKEAKRKTG